MKQALGLYKCGAEVKNCIRWYLQYAMAKLKTLDAWELVLLKVCLIAFGAWLGTAFAKTVKRFRHLFLIAFLGPCIYFVWRLFCCTEE